MYLIDTHCHLDAYSPAELKERVSMAQSSGVRQMITVGTHPKDWLKHKAVHLEYGRCILYTAGLHPSYVNTETIKAIDTLPSWFEGAHAPVALGECGLDYHHLDADPTIAASQKILQREAFMQQLALAKRFDWPVIIHCRQAFRECIELIAASNVSAKRILFHCFSEGLEAMRELLVRGYRASFTGILTYKNAVGVREAALLQGLDTLILETDAPWLAPVPKRGEPNQPAYLSHTAAYAANLFGVPLEKLIALTTQNAQSFFSLPSLE